MLDGATVLYGSAPELRATLDYLLDEKNELHNRSLHIRGMFGEADIEKQKADIEKQKADIERVLTPFVKLFRTNLLYVHYYE